ncbi:MAG: 2-oxoacid:acceptor oxidoreductase family protein [Pseudomonadota bacterium]
MEATNIVLCGLGGQGILFMTKVVAHAALAKGFKVMGAETHGMAQRGGSVISHLRLGEVQSSLIRAGSAHLLLSLDENEGYRNLPFLARNSRMFVNSSSGRFPREDVEKFLDAREIISRAVPAGEIARDLGAPLSSNLALLGYYAAFGNGSAGAGEMRRTIEKLSPDRFREKNLEVYDAGLQRGRGERPL